MQIRAYAADLESRLAVSQDAGEGYFAPTWRDSPVLFFAFVEDVDEILPGSPAYGLDGRQVRAIPSSTPLVHIRFSGIRTTEFFPMAENIEPLDPEEATTEQRQRRTEQLRESLDGIPLPVVDVFIGSERMRTFRVRPNFGNWWVLGISAILSALDEDVITAQVYVPELIAGSTDDGFVVLLAPAPPRWEARLRDIFSLVHLSDAEFGSTPTSEGSPVPLPYEPSPVEDAAAEKTNKKPDDLQIQQYFQNSNRYQDH